MRRLSIYVVQPEASMTSLEQIVLPLAESRLLAEKGVALDTVAWWQRSLAHIDHPVSVHIKGDNCDIEDFFEDICPAPTLSELLDAIRAKVGNPLDERNIILAQDGRREVPCRAEVRYCGDKCQAAYNDTDLLAAASLLLEVSR